MFPRSHPKPKDLAREASLAFERVRDHWRTCAACREAASSSASLWCPTGLDLMKRGVTVHAHWDTCDACRAAQARVGAGQCEVGRELERDYRTRAQRLAGR